jgi:serine/threonine-protein kinase
MAEIYLCSSVGPEDFHKQVAVKRIRPFLAADPSFVEMFIAEASIASLLNHPNVVQIFDFDKHQDTYYLAMEYVRGRSLWQLQNRAKQLLLPVPPLLVARIGSEVARGLDYAHRLTQNGRPLMLVHRDVSPQNVLLSYDGAVKLTDFGIAKATTRVTAPGMVKGKFAYMSPEQARGEAVDARTDIFALGIVLWELVTGQALFDAPSDVSVLRAVQERHIRPPRSVGVDLPSDLEAAILKALERDPEKRFQTAQPMHRALAESVMRHARTLEDTDVGAFLSALFEEAPPPEKQPHPGVSHGAPPRGGGTLVMMKPETAPEEVRPPAGAPPHPPEAPAPVVPSEKKEPPAPLPATYISPPPVANAPPDAGSTLPSFTPSGGGPQAGHSLPFDEPERPPQPTAQAGTGREKPPKTLPIDEPSPQQPSVSLSKPLAEGGTLDKLLKQARPLLSRDLPLLWPKMAIAAAALLFFALAGMGIHWALSPVPAPSAPAPADEVPPKPAPSTPTVIVETPPPPPAAEPTPPPPPPNAEPTPTAEPPPPPPPPAAEPSDERPVSRAYGTLVLNLRPWAEVSIDNKPYVEVYGRRTYRLPAGIHRVRMRYPGGSKVFEVVIERGRTFTYEHGPKDK